MSDSNEWSEFYSDASSAAALETSELKAALPIAYVLEDCNIETVQQSDGKLRASCPLHVDSNPSFDVYGPDLEKWGCYPCSLSGDVFDLIQRVYALPDFAATRDKAAELLTQMWTKGWEGPRKSEKKVLDTNFVKQVIDGALANEDLTLVGQLIDEKNAPYTADWLHQTFGVGVYGAWIVIPYADKDGNPITFKHRTPTTKPHALGGSDFGRVLYGEWRDDPEKPVLLCEGESDVWSATFAVGNEFSVLGLPTGAGANTHGEQIESLRGRKVILAFDGDATGRNAIRRWYVALTAIECIVTVAPIADGKDLSTTDDIAGAIALARPIPAVPRGLRNESTGYVRPPRKEDDVPTPISNWTFQPTRELIGVNGSAFEGIVMPSGDESVLSTFDLSSKSRMVAWAAKHGGAWYGSDRDAQLLLGLLQAEAPFLSVGRMTTVAGLHEGHFIWPGGKIGPEHWQYVAPAADVHLENKIKVEVGQWEPSYITTIRELHHHKVMDPILAWLAVAPLRSLLHEFPILAVMGPSGSGKTTLLETVVPIFSGADIPNTLTSTTPHSLFAHIGSTNGFPVRFDEYRPGARKGTLAALDQLLRDAYTGQPSSKGGMGDQWAEVVSVATTAPVVVSGEDAFSEVSHLQRMVSLNLPIAGKRADVLQQVRTWETPNGLPLAYLTWLYEGLKQGFLPNIANYESGPEELHERHRKNLGVLDLGWDLLTRFLLPFGIELSEPDWSLVTEEALNTAGHAPIEDALLWAMEEPEAMYFVCRQIVDDELFLAVRLENFVHFVKQKSSFVLPGGVVAVRKYLEAKYGAYTAVAEHAGGKKTMLFVNYDALQLD